MTPQEFFDKSLHAMRARRYETAHEGGHCRYRAPNGLQCLIGIHIPDELYDPDMEGLGVWELLKGWPRLHPIFAGLDRLLLTAVQCAHDELVRFSYSGDGDWFERSMKTIAEANGLTYGPPCPAPATP